MAWISVDQKFIGGKLRKLYKAIGCSQNEAMGLLVGLWLWGIDNAESDGLIVSADQEDIAEVVRPGLSPGLDAEYVIDCLIQNGWIDIEEGQLYFHDWNEWRSYYNRYVNEKRKHAARTQKYREKKSAMEKMNSDAESDVHSDEKSDGENIEKQQLPEKKKKSSAYTTDFEAFWSIYPRKVDKGQAYKKYQARMKDGFSPEELLQAAECYARQCQTQRTEPQYIKHAKTFLGDATPFVDYIPKKPVTYTGQASIPDDGANPFRRM